MPNLKRSIKPGPVSESDTRSSDPIKAAATSKLIEAAKKRIGTKIPTGEDIIASKGARNAAKSRAVRLNYTTPDAKQAQWTIARTRETFPGSIRNHVLGLSREEQAKMGKKKGESNA